MKGYIKTIAAGLGIAFVVLIGVVVFKHMTPQLEDLAEHRVLAWNDEFDFLNTDIWDYETGAVRNKELQLYTPKEENVFCSEGILHLKAMKNNPDAEHKWSSGALISRKGFAFGYGLIEAKVKYDPQEGCWPAFWGKGYHYWRDYSAAVNLGVDWPECGEIDMVEYIYGNHYCPGGFWYREDVKSVQSGKSEASEFEFDDAWHIIGMERTENEIKFFYDRNYVGKLPAGNCQDELFQPYNVLLNLAIGGGAQQNPEETLTETEFLVDWLRYYLPEDARKVEKPSSLKLDCGTGFELRKGQRRVLQPLFDVAYPSNYHVAWHSSDESVATCYAGTVKTISNGTTKITASTPDGLEATAVLSVTDSADNPAEEIELYADSSVIDFHAPTEIRSVVKPEYATNTSLRWKSSDPSVATVDDGVVNAINPSGGEVVITCSSADGSARNCVVLQCKPEAQDVINTDGIVVKYTKRGWGNTVWKSDLPGGIDFEAIGNPSMGFKFLSGQGYQQKYISNSSPYADSGDHFAGTDLFDINGPFTAVVRIVYPTGAEDSGGNALVIAKEGSDSAAVQLQSTHLYMRDTSGATVVNESFAIDEDTTHDRIITMVLTKDADRMVRLYINGKKTIESGVYSEQGEMNVSGMQFGIGNQSITNAVYQALLAYDRALNDEEVSALVKSLNQMYE